MQTAFDFSFELLRGGTLSLSTFVGKILLIVNTASECGFTSQLKDLEALHQEYKDKGLVVIAVPCNDFGGQEPGTATEIQHTACEIYTATYLMTTKANVTSAPPHPFYAWASTQVGVLGQPRWNFHKYLIGKDGKVRDWFSSLTKPTSAKIKEAIDAALA